MGALRLVYRLVGLILIQGVIGFLGLVGAILLLPFRKARYALILYLTKLWGQLCCRVINVHIQQEGSLKKTYPGALIVSNHIGTVDIFVVAACFGAFFVSKSDVRSWPLVGLLAQLGGTIFINRTRKTQVSAMVQNMTDRLRSGFPVAVFPEGRATSGCRVEPFKSSSFEAVVQAKRHVVPVMIRYYDAGDPSVACWPDGTTFVENMVQLFMHPRMSARVVVLPEVTGEVDRRAFAETSRRLIEQKFEETR